MSFEFGLELAGIFLGVAARSLVPWLRKLRDGTAARFSRRYFLSMLASLALCFIITMAVFPDFKAAPPAGPLSSSAPVHPFELNFRLFCLAFGFGFGFNAILLEGGQWLSSAPHRTDLSIIDKSSDKPVSRGK